MNSSGFQAMNKLLETLPTAADELRETILSALDQRKEWSEVPRLVLRYLRLGHPEAKLIDTLTFATVREDLDFHTMSRYFATYVINEPLITRANGTRAGKDRPCLRRW